MRVSARASFLMMLSLKTEASSQANRSLSGLSPLFHQWGASSKPGKGFGFEREGSPLQSYLGCPPQQEGECSLQMALPVWGIQKLSLALPLQSMQSRNSLEAPQTERNFPLMVQIAPSSRSRLTPFWSCQPGGQGRLFQLQGASFSFKVSPHWWIFLAKSQSSWKSWGELGFLLQCSYLPSFKEPSFDHQRIPAQIYQASSSEQALSGVDLTFYKDFCQQVLQQPPEELRTALLETNLQNRTHLVQLLNGLHDREISEAMVEIFKTVQQEPDGQAWLEKEALSQLLRHYAKGNEHAPFPLFKEFVEQVGTQALKKVLLQRKTEGKTILDEILASPLIATSGELGDWFTESLEKMVERDEDKGWLLRSILANYEACTDADYWSYFEKLIDENKQAFKVIEKSNFEVNEDLLPELLEVLGKDEGNNLSLALLQTTEGRKKVTSRMLPLFIGMLETSEGRKWLLDHVLPYCMTLRETDSLSSYRAFLLSMIDRLELQALSAYFSSEGLQLHFTLDDRRRVFYDQALLRLCRHLGQLEDASIINLLRNLFIVQIDLSWSLLSEPNQASVLNHLIGWTSRFTDAVLALETERAAPILWAVGFNPEFNAAPYPSNIYGLLATVLALTEPSSDEGRLAKQLSQIYGRTNDYLCEIFVKALGGDLARHGILPFLFQSPSSVVQWLLEQKISTITIPALFLSHRLGLHYKAMGEAIGISKALCKHPVRSLNHRWPEFKVKLENFLGALPRTGDS